MQYYKFKLVIYKRRLLNPRLYITNLNLTVGGIQL